MELYPGAHLIECEIGGRPLYLPLLLEEREAVLLDCGTWGHAEREIPDFLDKLGVKAESLAWLIITHPDIDHCGGTGEIKRRHPAVRIACGAADQTLVESPEFLLSFRYDHYREDHGIAYEQTTIDGIRSSCSGPQVVSLTFVGGETLRLGENRVLEIWHLPGHSHGHLGLYDRAHRTLFYGDAIQGAGYKSLTNEWVLCPTYLYVEPYLQTIRTIENSEAEFIIGCHWPVRHGVHEIKAFCAESRNFVQSADRLIRSYLASHPKGATLLELCEALGGKLGDWPATANRELAYAFLGHIEQAVSWGAINIDRSVRPVVYRSG